MTDGLPEPGRNCWRVEDASRAAVIVDAANYFHHARAAMLKAERRIMLIGWDFDARITLEQSPGDGGPPQVGDFLLWLVRRKPALNVHILRWDLGALKSLFRGMNLPLTLRMLLHRRISARLDRHHPTGGSHHQKIVVIDDCLAFCGGIDMTAERWDTREHRDDDPNRITPSGSPCKPWHDATTAVEGPAAAALGKLGRERWQRAGGKALSPITARHDCWPDDLQPDFTKVRVAIARSAPKMPREPEIVEVERLFLDHVARARRMLYAESQYFASRRIAEAIARRLDEPDGPEIVLVNPVTAQGWLEPLAMDTARARLVEALRRRDKHGRFRLYHPFTAGGEPIYVHAKVMIVDDQVLRVGSSNLNNRSLRLDTECDVTIDAALPGNEDAPARISAIRDDLLAEHLAVSPEAIAETVARTGSLIATVEALRGPGRSLRPFEQPDLSAVEKWLADHEVLDPEGPDEMFEPLSKRGLFRGRLHLRKR
ncbi:phospholipase D-like domain-containing protein [Sphingomonas jatrophae]|uniref:Phospholipase D n=1 Tax=Sphingomonas jatrophae TaxID=1166337 RepID=A0A1I6K2U9_9SPHN|nr:phospholipase D-like domain-containing protein [Sphingomonas jatrophae]SFR85507.1 Phosphatidylserine/phosphatidylglycerophosphate/cardiolipin synthase [Sphingomonas jatrophae]